MKTIIGILLVGLLGFLGCSDSDDATRTVGEAIPVAPFGTIETNTPTYKWTPVPGATRYRLLVQDANETAVTEEWYSAEDSGCASEDVLCMVTPDIEVFKENTWMVQACATDENCALSEPMKFFVRWGFRGTRFYISEDDTWIVYDSYTRLFWTRHARTQIFYPPPTPCRGMTPCHSVTNSTRDQARPAGESRNYGSCRV